MPQALHNITPRDFSFLHSGVCVHLQLKQTLPECGPVFLALLESVSGATMSTPPTFPLTFSTFVAFAFDPAESILNRDDKPRFFAVGDSAA